MSYENNQPSLAVQAHCCQNLYEPSEKYPDATPSDTLFPRHDAFQNGVIENGTPATFYTAATDKDIENVKNHNCNMSGFLTDETTLNACKNENGVLDANQYADMTQTRPWRPEEAPSGTDYTYRENIAAFNVNWDELNKPENADLKERLCDDQGNLKCAFGKAEENTHWGEGGGNQYYFRKSDFNEGVNRGVFEYDGKKTLKESDGTLMRTGVSENEMRLMDDERLYNVQKTLSSCQDQNATTDIEKARALNEITPEKANQINLVQASEGNYLAKPDPAYNYNRGSAANAETANGQIAGRLPAESAPPPQHGPPEIAGQKPPKPQPTPDNIEPQIAGTTPDKRQPLDLNTAKADGAAANTLSDEATKAFGKGVATGTGIT